MQTVFRVFLVAVLVLVGIPGRIAELSVVGGYLKNNLQLFSAFFPSHRFQAHLQQATTRHLHTSSSTLTSQHHPPSAAHSLSRSSARIEPALRTASRSVVRIRTPPEHGKQHHRRLHDTPVRLRLPVPDTGESPVAGQSLYRRENLQNHPSHTQIQQTQHISRRERARALKRVSTRSTLALALAAAFSS